MNFSRPRGFTLVELLVVISILSVLSTAAIIVLNPAELLKRGRDSRRIGDLASIERAIGAVEADRPGIFTGNPNLVYVSLSDNGIDDTSDPDLTPDDCDELGLPALPAGWDYKCSTAANFRKVDGTGWVPVNLASFSAGSPLAVLPVDPINTVLSGYYYTYVSGSFKLTALLESKKELKKMSGDGGADPALYEKGTGLNLANFQRGLAGYWKMDEKSGTSAADSSGNSNNGTLVNGPTWTAGKVDGASSFDGINDYVSVPDSISLRPTTNEQTIMAWVYTDTVNSVYHQIFAKGPSANREYELRLSNANKWQYITYGTVQCVADSNSTPVPSQWYHVAGVYDGLSARIYVNGAEAASPVSCVSTLKISNGTLAIGSLPNGQYWDGMIDDLRIYNHALSESEIQTIYETTK